VQSLPIRLLEAAGAREKHRDLGADARDELLLPLRELSPSGPPDQVECALHALVEHEGQHQPGLVGKAAEQIMAEARIGSHVVRQHRASLVPDRSVESLLAQG
jgi:hypothetical protein